MKPYLTGFISALLLSFLAACSDNNNNGPTPEPPIEPETPNLDATGIYSGTVETQVGDISLMSIFVARTGETTITFETDDSEQASIVLWGTSKGDANELTFEGDDADSGAAASITLSVNEAEVTGELSLDALTGTFSLTKTGFSDSVSSLGAIAGTYFRQDNASGSSSLTISDDGSVQLSGSCEASGTLKEVDKAVNIYTLQLESNCIDLDALVSLEQSAVANDTVVINGSAGDSSISLAFYRG